MSLDLITVWPQRYILRCERRKDLDQNQGTLPDHSLYVGSSSGLTHRLCYHFTPGLGTLFTRRFNPVAVHAIDMRRPQNIKACLAWQRQRRLQRQRQQQRRQLQQQHRRSCKSKSRSWSRSKNRCRRSRRWRRHSKATAAARRRRSGTRGSRRRHQATSRHHRRCGCAAAPLPAARAAPQLGGHHRHRQG
jgi:predicted GIY-YIG superfamily endonuclease